MPIVTYSLVRNEGNVTVNSYYLYAMHFHFISFLYFFEFLMYPNRIFYFPNLEEIISWFATK